MMQDWFFWWHDMNVYPTDDEDYKKFLVEIWNPDAQAKEQEVLLWFKTYPPGRGFRKRSPKDSVIYRWRELPLDPTGNSEEKAFKSGVKWWSIEEAYPGDLKRQLLLCDAKGVIDAGYLNVEENKLKVRSPDLDIGMEEPIYWSEIVPLDNSLPYR